MKVVLRISLDLASWIYGLYVLAFVAPGPILRWWLCGMAFSLLGRVLAGPWPKLVGIDRTLLGIPALLHFVGYLVAWGCGWPEPSRTVLFYSTLVLSPLIVIRREMES